MAHIGSCRLCKRRTLNTNIHPECELASLRDLLFRIREQIVGHPNDPLPPPLKKEVKDGAFQSMKEFKKLEDNKEDLKLQKEIWEIERSEFLQEAARKFEKKNPDPDPPRC